MSEGFQALLTAAREVVTEIPATEVQAFGERPDAVLLDVREPSETESGIIPGAERVPRGLLEMEIERLVPDMDTPIAVYCAAGVRSALAAATLLGMGYRNVVSVAGGFGAYKRAGGQTAVRAQLSADQQERYRRHLSLPEVGAEGQLKLLESRVLCVGAGGLGSPAALYLAAAGVGTLGLIDDDVVDRSNLQRQLLHTDARVGVPKVDSAALTLQALNPDVRVEKHHKRLDASCALELVADYDVVVDGTDNFPTRYLLNDACVLRGVPLVYGAIFRFDGQASVFAPGRGPCYRCLYPEPPPAELAPNCAEAGVLGVLPGVIGVMQATETVKLLLGLGTPLIGRVCTYDALAMSFRELRVRRDPGCPACGDTPRITDLVAYEQHCSAPDAPGAGAGPKAPNV